MAGGLRGLPVFTTETCVVSFDTVCSLLVYRGSENTAKSIRLASHLQWVRYSWVWKSCSLLLNLEGPLLRPLCCCLTSVLLKSLWIHVAVVMSWDDALHKLTLFCMMNCLRLCCLCICVYMLTAVKWLLTYRIWWISSPKCPDDNSLTEALQTEACSFLNWVNISHVASSTFPAGFQLSLAWLSFPGTPAFS